MRTRKASNKDLPPRMVCVGNPAKPIRKRFGDREVALLLEMAWWDWPVERIERAMPLLCSGDIEALHAFWRSEG